MPAELFKVKLLRENAADTWGFHLSGGGEQLLAISEVWHFKDYFISYNNSQEN